MRLIGYIEPDAYVILDVLLCEGRLNHSIGLMLPELGLFDCFDRDRVARSSSISYSLAFIFQNWNQGLRSRILESVLWTCAPNTRFTI